MTLAGEATASFAASATTTSKAFRMSFVGTVGVFLLGEEVHVVIFGLSVVFISIIFEILGVFHLDGGVSGSFRGTVGEDESMLIITGVLV